MTLIYYDKNTLSNNGNSVPFWSANIIGQKRYELSNHLGNVMAVVSDKITESTAGTRASLWAAYDYYPFGMQMPMRSVEDESIHCVPVSRTRYENVRVPLSPTGISDIFATATKLPFDGGGSTVVFDKTATSVDVTVANHGAPVALGTEFELPALSGAAVGLNFTFRATTIGQEPIEGFLKYYNAGKNEWRDLRYLVVEEGSNGDFVFEVPEVPSGVPLKVVVRTEESEGLSLYAMDYNILTDGLVADGSVSNSPSSALAQSTNVPFVGPEAGVMFSKGPNFVHHQVPGNKPPVPLGAELPLPVLTGSARGLSMALKVANSGQAPIHGSLQRYNPNYNHWEEVVSDVVGTGGSLHFDMENGLPLGVPLKLVVTTDVGQFLHLDNMSYGRYQSDQVYSADVSSGVHSAFAGSVNLPLAPLPAELTLASGATSVSLNVSNDVSADMGVELSLPQLGAGESGMELSFEGSSDGEHGVEASLQANLNGVWQEVSSGVLGGSGGVLSLVSGELPAGSALKLVVSSSKGKYVDMGGLVYTTITKAVQTYMALSCDTDAAWGLAARGFNGQLRMDELAGKGNWYTATYWEYNAPLGRRMNVDPVDQISISNYAVMGLNPIMNNDPLGNKVKKASDLKSGKEKWSKFDTQKDEIGLSTVTIKASGKPNAKTSDLAAGVTHEMSGLIRFDGVYLKGRDEKNDFGYFFGDDEFNNPFKRLDNFLDGTGPTNMVYGPKTEWTQDLMGYNAVEKGREFFYRKFAGQTSLTGLESVNQFKIPWGARQIITMGRNAFKHFPGQAALSIYSSEDCKRLIFVMYSSASNWSFKLHFPSVKNIARTKEVSGYDNRDPDYSTINNIWIWSEPVNNQRLIKGE